MTSKHISRKSKILLSLVMGAVIVLLGLAVFATWQQFLDHHDPAYAAAKPIEEGLIKAGATKMCSYGDSGLGIDNDEPWYTAYYTSPKPVDEIARFFEESANDTKITFEESSEKSTTRFFRAQGVELQARIWDHGEFNLGSGECSDASKVKATAAQPVISISIKLPSQGSPFGI